MRSILTATLLLLCFTDGLAQRVSYPQLVNRNQLPQVYINEIILPDTSGNHSMVLSFSFQYEFIPFKKVPIEPDFTVPEDMDYFAIIRLNSEIFEGAPEERRNSEPVSRDVWIDTVFTSTFENTRSRDLFARGSLRVQLRPGIYNYLLQLNTQDASRDRTTPRQRLLIPDLSKNNRGEIYYIREGEGDENRLPLIDMNNSVPFGDDFRTLIRIPEGAENENLRLLIEKVRTSEDDTVAVEEIYSQELNMKGLLSDRKLDYIMDEQPYLSLRSNGGINYLLLNIPNSSFESSIYRMSILSDERDRPVGRRLFRSLWADMPASLYNLNIAIDHLSYILPEDRVKEMKRGSMEEKEKRFRTFWDQRDPTPETVYNELMAEYYRRIDYAFKEYGSPQNPMGHETDMGEVYIKYGPPNKTERFFPTNGNAREKWFYDNRTFVFEATSGFGDFRLVGTE